MPSRHLRWEQQVTVLKQCPEFKMQWHSLDDFGGLCIFGAYFCSLWRQQQNCHKGQQWGEQKLVYSFGDFSAGVKVQKPNHMSLKFGVDWTNNKIILGQWIVPGHSVSNWFLQRQWGKWRSCAGGQLVPHQAVGAPRSRPSCAACCALWKVDLSISLAFLPWKWPCIWVCLHRLPSSLTVFYKGDSSPTTYKIRAYITTLS